MNPISEAILLAGGLGTRLRSVLPDTPKPLVPIAGKPFLELLMEGLAEAGIRRLILSIGYKRELFYEVFQNWGERAEVVFAPEEKLLGTGGALKNALSLVRGENFLALNGDTFAEINLQKLIQFHYDEKADITLAALSLENQGRYGSLKLEGQRVVRFNEKSFEKQVFINAGTYAIRKSAFDEVRLGNVCSFERDLLPPWLSTKRVMAFPFEGKFLDLGVPEDLALAERCIPQWIQQNEQRGASLSCR